MTVLADLIAAISVPFALHVGAVELPTGVIPNWDTAWRRVEVEAPIYQLCQREVTRCPDLDIRTWRHTLDDLRAADELTQLREVHRFVTQYPWQDDRSRFGRSDYWASPLEFFRGAGDCEDFAITNYVSLRDLGIAPSRMRLLVFAASATEPAHAVLGITVNDDVVILDNNYRELRSIVDYADRKLVYSMNEHAVWHHPELGEIHPAGRGR